MTCESCQGYVPQETIRLQKDVKELENKVKEQEVRFLNLIQALDICPECYHKLEYEIPYSVQPVEFCCTNCDWTGE